MKYFQRQVLFNVRKEKYFELYNIYKKVNNERNINKYYIYMDITDNMKKMNVYVNNSIPIIFSLFYQ